jgi:hypothetical protein
MALPIYTVWTKSEYEADLLAIFTDEASAQEYANNHNGKICPDEAYESAREAEAMQLF